jgi:hypothetical protein
LTASERVVEKLPELIKEALHFLSIVIPARDEEGCISSLPWGSTTKWQTTGKILAASTLENGNWPERTKLRAQNRESSCKISN